MVLHEIYELVLPYANCLIKDDQTYMNIIDTIVPHYSYHKFKIDIWGHADIHIFVFADCENNRFKKKFTRQNKNA